MENGCAFIHLAPNLICFDELNMLALIHPLMEIPYSENTSMFGEAKEVLLCLV